MATIPPVACIWTGDVFAPLDRQLARARHYYGAGEVVSLAPFEERSEISHNHEFAFLNEAWKNLPEEYADALPTPEHLRKRLLIQTGWFEETAIDVGSVAGAERVAGHIRQREPFSYVIQRGGFVIVRVAKSQSRRAMNKEDFQKSKQDIMDAAEKLLEVEPGGLAKNAETVA